MPTIIVPAIPASQLVNIVPSTIAVSPAGLQLNGMLITNNTDSFGYSILPMGSVYNFADAVDVGGFFGETSQESGLAGVYFAGPNNSLTSPVALLATAYPTSSMPGYLRGGNVSGTTLGTLQTINGNLTVTIDAGSPISATVNLSTATSFSNAAQIIGSTLGINGTPQGTYMGSLSTVSSVPTLTVTSVINGPRQAVCIASLSGVTMTVSAITSGLLAIGQVVSGTGITVGTTITGYNSGGAPGGPGNYTLSQSATTETLETVTAYAPAGNLGVGQVIAATGVTGATYISALGTGTGGVGTYVLSQSVVTEATETINAYAPGCVYLPLQGAFQINSSTTGANSSVSFASGAAAGPLGLTLATGAVQSPGTIASPAGTSGVPGAFMTALTTKSQDWVSWMTTWEPCDVDKKAFATWNGQQGTRFIYEMLETNPIDINPSGPSAPVAAIDIANTNGVEIIYQNPVITTLFGEKAAFAMGWTASINFNITNGRRSMAYASYGGSPDITNGTIAETLAGNPQTSNNGFGINFYGEYTTANAAYNYWQRGFISGPFLWKDSYIDAVWLAANLQSSILVGRSTAYSLPYAQPGYAQIAAWCQGPILAAVNFGAIVPGVTLSQGEIQQANNQAGIDISRVLFNAGWFLQIGDASPASRVARTSPPCMLWFVDGQQIQSINLGVVELQ